MSRCTSVYKVCTAVAGILTCFSAGAVAAVPYSKHNARQVAPAPPCVPQDLLGRVSSSTGGRKIGIVVDNSYSMEDNDPTNIRFQATNALNDALVSQAEAVNGKSADLVTIVDFCGSAEVLYPLGDPAGGNGVIDQTVLCGSTAIGRGIEAALDELTKPGNDPTANRTGIVVFTDGQDDPSSGLTRTIAQTQRAVQLGVRISFGFLSVDSSFQNSEILRAVLSSGGIYATIDDAAGQQAFIALALATGLTAQDAAGTNGTTTLLPGVATASFLSTGSNTYSYSAKAGETFNVTLTSVDLVPLQLELKESGSNTVFKTNNTNDEGEAFLDYTVSQDTNIDVVVTPTGGSNTSAIFSVALRSSLDSAGNCSITPNATTPTNTTRPTYSPTISPPVQFTGAASVMSYSLFSAGILAFVAALM